MAIVALQVEQFRNLVSVSINPAAGINLVIGPNGSGKTSLLESIYYLSSGKSFRTSQTSRLVTRGSDVLTVVSRLQNPSSQHQLGIKRGGGQSQLRVDGSTAKSFVELAQLLPVAIIESSLHQLIDGPPEHRRRFLDWGVFHVEHQFNVVWNRYQRLLKQRNAALKARWSAKAIANWDKDFVPTALSLHDFRIQYLERFQAETHRFSRWFPLLDTLSIEYQPGWAGNGGFAIALQEQLDSDRHRGFTQSGPHRGDLRFMISGQGVKDSLSRGQQKLLAASLILSQSGFLLGRDIPSVILVDDLPAELDDFHRKQFIHALVATGAQVFITSTDLDIVEDVQACTESYHLFHVEQGRVRVGECLSADVNSDLVV